jgi:hypothetical protein
MKRVIYLIILVSLFTISACETDTYDLPAETLAGQLTDPDGEPLITEQPNGFQIRMLEEGATQYYDFWGKADGSFKNTKIFRAKYSIVPFNGPFFEVEPQLYEVRGVTTVNFTVIPYCKIKADIVLENKDVKATFRITKAAGAGKIKEAQLLVSKWNPNVGVFYKDKSAALTFSDMNDADVQEALHSLAISGYLDSGVTYYARIAVLCDNTLGRYNLSAVTRIVVP